MSFYTVFMFYSIGANAFDFLMNNARKLTIPSLPSKISEVRNQKLHNDVIDFLQQRHLNWKPNEVECVGKAFLKVLVDTLWSIDGHHQVLGKRGHKIPQLFHLFVGYNNPETSKHRKRNLQTFLKLQFLTYRVNCLHSYNIRLLHYNC